MLIVLAVGIIGLYRLSIHVTRHAQLVDPSNRPGSGTIVRSELIHVWLPPTLSELARLQSESPVVRTHKELQEYLAQRDGEKLWYAIVARAHQVDGRVIDLTFIRWPYDEGYSFKDMLDILATAAGNLPGGPEGDYAKASVDIMGPDLLKHDPREVVADLIEHSPSVEDQEKTR